MIIKDNKELSNIMLNNKEFTSIKYIDGNNEEIELWGSGKVIPLGLGTSFDIKPIYEKWAELTIDDFFITPREGDLVVNQYSCREWSGSSCLDCSDIRDNVQFSKSYNAETGIFTCSYAGSVHAFLIPNSNKLIEKGKIVSLGSVPAGTQVDIRSIEPKYNSLTLDNFLVREYPPQWSDYICCSWSCWNSIWTTKSYNNGLFLGHAAGQRTDYEHFPENIPRNVNWFLIRPSIMR